LATEDIASPQHARLELIESGFGLPTLVVEGGELLGQGEPGIEDGGEQPVERLGGLDALKRVLDDAHHAAVAIIAAVLGRRVDAAQVGAVLEPLVARQQGPCA